MMIMMMMMLTLTLELVAGWQLPTFPHLIPFLPPSAKVEEKVINQKQNLPLKIVPILK